MEQKHEHHHDHDEHGSELSEMQLRVRALETVLIEKGYVDPEALDAVIEAYETKVGPQRAACFRISASCCPPIPPFASGIRPPRPVLSFYQCGPTAPRAGARKNSRAWSRATA